MSETRTENLFRTFYGTGTFIEKSAIPTTSGFTSKKSTGETGYPDFYRDEEEYAIVVEAKATAHDQAEADVQHYLATNTVTKDLVGIAVSGQTQETLRATYFHRRYGTTDIKVIAGLTHLVDLIPLQRAVRKAVHGTTLTDEQLKAELKKLNEKFHTTVRDTERSMFFSGLMIALTDATFRSSYKVIQAPTPAEVKANTSAVILEASNLNTAIVDAINRQLTGKVNNRSKKLDWQDRFSFIKNVDFPIEGYKKIISTIEEKIFIPYQNEENQDILGKAYKIFLSRAGKMDNKNIILTPDHVKAFMVKLARLGPDDVVLDTCTGTGGFLMQAMEDLCAMAGGDAAKIEHIKNQQLIGFENDVVLFSLACSNMFLHGDGRSTLLYRSSLLDMSKTEDVDLFQYVRSLRPNKCIINPPYEGSLPIQFTEQALNYLEPGGQLVIIMPETTLNKHTSRTKTLLKTAKLDYVVRMPEKLFSEQGRAVNTAVFGFTKTPHDPADEVLFYDLTDDGFESVQHKGRLDLAGRWSDIESEAVSAIRNAREVPGTSEKRLIFRDEVLHANGCQPDSKGSSYTQVAVGDLFVISEGTLASTQADETGPYTFVTASSEWKSHTSFTHDTEALVIAVGAAGSLGRTHFVSGKFVASNLCLVMTPKPETRFPVSLEFYNHYFGAIRERLVSDLASGTSKKTIAKTRLASYLIDYVPLEVQNEFVERHSRTLAALRAQLVAAEANMNTELADIVAAGG